jgi:S1-C subfamily serine protease
LRIPEQRFQLHAPDWPGTKWFLPVAFWTRKPFTSWIASHIILPRMKPSCSIFRKVEAVSLLLPFLAAFVASAWAQGVVQGFEKEIQAVVAKTQDCVVRIKTIVPVTDVNKSAVVGEGLSVGSGFFIDTKGHILTTASVLRGADKAMVYWRDKTYEAQSLGYDIRTNVAVLKIDDTTPCLSLGNPHTLMTGSWSMVVGYPLDGPLCAEYGFVSDPSCIRGLIATQGSSQTGKLFATSRIRSSVRVYPGQSGSPQINVRGEVIGMVVHAMLDDSSTYALPITAACKIQKDLLKVHAPRHGWTGITVQEKRTEIRAENRKIAVDVFVGQPAHIAGIRPGDVLKKIGDKEITNFAEVVDATFYLSIGDTVNFSVERNGEVLRIPVKVAPRPTDQELLAMKTISSPPSP